MSCGIAGLRSRERLSINLTQRGLHGRMLFVASSTSTSAFTDRGAFGTVGHARQSRQFPFGRAKTMRTPSTATSPSPCSMRRYP